MNYYVASLNLTCCNQEAKWVENVPGKGYYFCSNCRKEVDPNWEYKLAQETMEYAKSDDLATHWQLTPEQAEELNKALQALNADKDVAIADYNEDFWIL